MTPVTISIAAIQLNSGPSKTHNIENALTLCQKAITQKADILVLPELFNLRGTSICEEAESIPGPSLLPFIELAKQHKVGIIAGSICEKTSDDPDKVYNTCVVINEEGELISQYRKIHLFDVTLDSKSIQESKRFLPGALPKIVTLKGLKIGLAICFDLRFSELGLYYATQGVDLICYPSSFTTPTGKAHWETLLRARAIENQVFVCAPNQTGIGAGEVPTYGNSMVVDPWGDILCRSDEHSTDICIAAIDPERLRQVREKLPTLPNRKPLLSKTD